MTLQGIITTERRNTDKIYLHREGIFWKTYEKSAFAFIHRISRYKASKRFVKYLDSEVVSIGFPDASRKKVLGDRPLLEETEQMLVLDTTPIDIEEYDTWKSALPLAAVRPQHQPGGIALPNGNAASAPATPPLTPLTPPTPGRLYSGYTTPASTANGNGHTTPPPSPPNGNTHLQIRNGAVSRITLIEPKTAAPNGNGHANGTEEVPPADEPDEWTLRQNANILRDLRNFSVENATPLECLIFVSSLKKQLNGNI